MDAVADDLGHPGLVALSLPPPLQLFQDWVGAELLSTVGSSDDLYMSTMSWPSSEAAHGHVVRSAQSAMPIRRRLRNTDGRDTLNAWVERA
eukprot:CAMPEP_0170285046 /NCGR_PEP_ID=MMETSP0116_2-20130129/42567_1 /TAXON_ID=400756 /ORGANISM="Durinskia baltica, Strain CSIRO CS-38" /LENGTH=90 /DNA_ID=CAMNT_0010536437 /DNA_START=150 /DNA_END=419 /DNA_ORIENTATION=+